jgi:hypothetical protein
MCFNSLLLLVKLHYFLDFIEFTHFVYMSNILGTVDAFKYLLRYVELHYFLYFMHFISSKKAWSFVATSLCMT